jgi:hypothetical protein
LPEKYLAKDKHSCLVCLGHLCRRKKVLLGLKPVEDLRRVTSERRSASVANFILKNFFFVFDAPVK